MNEVRLAIGTLTVVPVRPPQVDRRVAGRSMVLAPLVGLLLAVPAAVLLELVLPPLSPPLAAALVIGLLALLTRGMHLDGLADTADGLGSGRPAAQALEIMRRGDVGPFGVVTLVVVLLVQVLALGQLLVTVDVGGGLGRGAAVAWALMVSRLVLPLACLSGIPAARADGLGSTVAGSVSRPMALLAVLLVATPAVALRLAGVAVPLVPLLVAAVLGLLPALALGARAVRRLGGITGDVLGALVETTFTATLVALCLV